MSRTGRPPRKIPRIAWKVQVRVDLAAKVELIVANPMREKADYGARSAYLEELIENDLNKRMEEAKGTSTHVRLRITELQMHRLITDGIGFQVYANGEAQIPRFVAEALQKENSLLDI